MSKLQDCAPSAPSAEQRAEAVVNRVLQQAESIPHDQGGGHKLDVQTLHCEVLGAFREMIDDLAHYPAGR